MGTRAHIKQSVTESQDHPHAYGDKSIICCDVVTPMGSSPRVWGQDQEYINGVYNDRIIPTRMGTSNPYFFQILTARDHPHAYGDKRYIVLALSSVVGSSPRVWGQGYLTCIVYVAQEDHPHAYGDKGISFWFFRLWSGSSPRVWGQADLVGSKTEVAGIIPTRMGTRIISSLGFPIAWDHPHAYGDKLALDVVVDVDVGSSPRVWGQDIYSVGDKTKAGIIPTRMGTRYYGNFLDYAP